MIAVVGFLFFVALYATGRWAIPASLLASWGVKPFRFPFLDTDTVLSALRCRRMGVDVFSTNPCDALGRVYDYSPAWLVGAALPVTKAWILPVGMMVDAIFLACLFLLPPARSMRATVLITLGVVSTPVAFALERANNDLVIFSLAAIAASLACRSQALRVIGYACAFLAGLLKYYPMLLMTLACRERPRIFFATAAVSVLLLAAFIGLDWNELRQALALIPTDTYFGDMFGARTLPLGLAELLDLPPPIGQLAQPVIILLCLIVAGAIGLRRGLAEDLARLTPRERAFLLAGAMLVIGCFFTAQNIGYRAIHLVMVLPTLTALATLGRQRRLYGVSAGIVVVLLWAEGWRHWLDALIDHRAPWAITDPNADDVPRALAWLLRECCWWWTVTVLIALSISLLLHSRMGREARRLLGMTTEPAAP